MFRRTAVVITLCLLLAPGGAIAQTKTTETLAPNEQKTFAPGYPVGNIALGNPKIADFKVMSASRRELLLFGRAEGQTMLTLWDQKGVKRHEVTIVVQKPVDPTVERELKGLLQDFPSVTVQTLGGQLILTGAVSSKDDFAAVERIATVAKVRSLVRYVPPVTTGGPGGAAAVPPSSVPSAAGGPTPAPGPGSKAADPGAPVPSGPHIEYEIELLEASSDFRSGSYATGIEPSGRRLYIGTVNATIGTDGQIFIGGKAVGGKGGTKTATSDVDQGIRLTLRPQVPDARGRFTTGVLVETNLPLGTNTYDPNTWRRARWTFAVTTGEPFGITGDDLLAAPGSTASGGSSVGSATRQAGRVARLPGVSSLPGTDVVPVFGSLFGSSSYKKNQTQLLVIIRPRLVIGGGN